MKVITKDQLAWLAGLIEGDGCYSFNRCPRITIQMKDKDTIQRVSNLWDSSYSSYQPLNVDHSLLFSSTIVGRKAAEMMNLLTPWMGCRRSSKIKEILNLYNNRNIKTQYSVGENPLLQKEILITELQGSSYRKVAHKYGVCHETIRRVVLSLNKSYPVKQNPFFELTKGEFSDSFFLWLAGLLEAEGSFTKGPPSQPNKVNVGIQMADEDIIETCAKYFGVSYYSYQRPPTEKTIFKKMFMCMIRGKKALDFMEKVKPYMSSRRQTQIQINKSYRSIATALGVDHETIRYAVHRIINWSDVSPLPQKVVNTLSGLEPGSARKRRNQCK